MMHIFNETEVFITDITVHSVSLFSKVVRQRDGRREHKKEGDSGAM